MSAGRTIGSAVLLAAGVSAVVAAAMVRWAPDTGPRIGSVRLTELTAEFMAGAVRDGESAEETAEAARRWAADLETALAVVAARRGIVLVSAEAVVAGAEDHTAEVRWTLMRVGEPAGLDWPAGLDGSGAPVPLEPEFQP
ncbi:TrbI F-type domain-containing protein [Candidatus Rariloculus sp.]|uniref:TrbI F-type domain-containing protein n=1 Tax=Candidatus Rariloculus sp. TaxID=3101265 RepID=UPI003D0DC3BD